MELHVCCCSTFPISVYFFHFSVCPLASLFLAPLFFFLNFSAFNCFLFPSFPLYFLLFFVFSFCVLCLSTSKVLVLRYSAILCMCRLDRAWVQLSSSDWTVWCRMVGQLVSSWIAIDVKGSGHALLSRHLFGVTEENNENVRVGAFGVVNRNQDLENTK